MGELAEFANKDSKYIKIASGSSFQAKYLGWNHGEYNGQALIEYSFQVEDDEKTFSSGSKKLARLMDAIKEKSIIKISKSGNGTSTEYTVEEVSGWDE